MERVSLTKKVYASDLREGDWLAADVKFGKKIIRKSWEGLSLAELERLRKCKRQIEIKEGIQFAPAFLIAFLVYSFSGFFFFQFFYYVKGFLI